MGQVGSAHIQPIWSVLTSGQLKNIRYQCCHTQAEDMDAYEAYSPADVGVEVAACSIDVGLSLSG